MLPHSVQKFVEIVSRLPSIGPRQATRLAFYLVNLGKNEINELAGAIDGLKTVDRCSDCFFIHGGQSKLCSICANSQRRRDCVAVVEKETDLLSLEKTGKFAGRYFVIGDLKKSGLPETEQKLRLNHLKKRIGDENNGGLIGEIILAINPTAYGDAGAFWLKQELKNHARKITRLGRGIPTGGEIEFADEETLGGALDNRG